ncbi:MAG: hypothetical protein IPH57_06600 [Saprospiraceae bacterium]|nr:hypothetical protein [Saprospiraceae bacterium]
MKNIPTFQKSQNKGISFLTVLLMVFVVLLGTSVTGYTEVGCTYINGSFNNTGTLDIELAGTTPCTGYDQVQVTGTVTLGGSLNLILLSGYTPVSGAQFIIISNDGTDAVSGQFAQAKTVSSGGYVFSINYAGGDGNDVVLTACGAGVVHNTTYNPDRHYCRIQDAIDDAGTGNTITVDNGTYYENVCHQQSWSYSEKFVRCNTGYPRK